MKTKTRDLEQSCGPKTGAYFPTSGSSWFFPLLLLSCWLSASLANDGASSQNPSPTGSATTLLAQSPQDANTTNALSPVTELPTVSQDKQCGNFPSTDTTKQTAETSSHDKFFITSGPAAVSLWKGRISTPESLVDETGKKELERIIQLVRSIRFAPGKKASKAAISAESAPTTEPNEACPVAEQANEPPQGQIIKSPDKRQDADIRPNRPMSDRTLQTLANKLQHLGQVRNPLQLAEVLFMSGRLKEAAICYQEALRRKDPNDVSLAQDRAWILFQTGNCLRKDEPSAAIEMYGKLITEYPKSPWAELAKVRQELTNWLEKNRPQTLISECLRSE